MKIRFPALLIALGLAAFLPAQDHHHGNLADLPPLVRKSFMANRTSKYSGERTVEFKHGPDRASHVEYVLKDGIRTRIEFPDDSEYKGQIIVDDGQQRLHYYPDRNEIDAEPAHRRDSRPEGHEGPEG